MGSKTQAENSTARGLKPFRHLCFTLALALLLPSCTLFHRAGKQKVGADEKQLTDEESHQLKSTYYDAEKEKIIGDYDQALFLFKTCLSIDPKNAAANFEIADILEGDKHSDSSLYYSQKAAQLEPQNIWFEDLYAQCLQDKGDYKAVAEVYRNIVKTNHSDADYYSKLAAAEMQAGENPAAIQTYNLMEQKFGFNEDVTMNKIRLFEKTKSYTEAEREIQKLIQKNPTTPEYTDMLANLYEMEGKTDKAFEMYMQMEAKNPTDPMVHLSLADYYRTHKNDSKSYSELELAFAEPSLEIDTKIRILLTFYEETNGHDSLMSEGLRLCQILVKVNPNDPKAHYTYGNFLVRNRELKEARDQYSVSISEDSSKYSIWSQLLLLDEALNDYKDLAASSKSAIGIFPGYPQLYLDNGIANIELKKFDSAISSLNAGLQYVLGDSGITLQFYSSLGEAYNSVKRFAASDSAYEAVLALNPNDDQSLNNYSYYLSLRNVNLEKAAEMSKKANTISPQNANYEDTYAWIFFKMGKYELAKQWQEGALRDGGDKNANILEHYGDILFALNEKEKAVEYWIKARDAGATSELIGREIKDKQYYAK